MLSRPALFLLACAAGTAAFAQHNPSPALDEGADRAARLVANARREGSLSLYASMAEKDLIRLVSEFERRYGIKVKVWRSGKNNVLRRAVTEARAGRFDVDLVHNPAPEMELLHRERLLQEVRSPYQRELIPEAVAPHREWAGPRVYVFVQAYNTNRVTPDELPKTFKDLLDPRWKGKMVWNPKSMTGAWGFISTVIKGMGEERGMAYLRALARQAIVPLPIAIRAVLDRVIAGEYAIGLEMNNTHAAISAAQGAPVKWVPLNPASETLQVAGITRGAAHPNAAKLFIDFMVSKAGQNVFRDNDYLPMHPDIPAKIPELRPEQGGYKSIIYTPDNLEVDVPRWAKIYEDLFR